MQPDDIAALAEFHPAAAAQAAEGAAGHDQTHSRVADLLYQEWYLHATKPATSAGPPQPVDVNLVGALEAAHVSSGRFEEGWTTLRSSTAGRAQAVEQSRAAEPGLTRTLRLGEYVNLAAPGHRPRSGDPLAVSLVSAEVEEGFWVTRNKAWWALSAGGALPPLTRVYFHVDLPHTTHAVRALSDALERWAGPYAFKVSLALHELQRPDSVVLYTSRDCFHDEVREILGPVVRALDEQGALGDSCPRLTARLHRGVSAVDGDAAGASFGADRCGLVARALLSAPEPDDIAQHVHDHFLESGLDPDRPYLEGGENRDYVALDRSR